MTEQEEKILAAREKGVASVAEQKEATQIIRDLLSSVREISEVNQRG